MIMCCSFVLLLWGITWLEQPHVSGVETVAYGAKSVGTILSTHDNRADEEEAGSVEEHKSLITCLSSQVRLGMDLTNVVLPTFIL